MAIRNGKEVFTTSIKSEVLEGLRQHCWDNNKKINEILETLINNYLKQQKKVSECQ